jgi:hypothetical protein
MNFELKHPSMGTVLGSIGAVAGLAALAVSLSGSADAGPRDALVRKGDIARGAVTAPTIAKGAVRAKALAKGSVHSKALAGNSVNTRILRKGSVTAGAIAANAVTASAISPGSIYGGALGPITIHTAPVTDLDASADLSTWTASDTATALCGVGERLLSGGVVFTNPGNRRVGIIEALPFSNSSANGFSGRVTTDAGGGATAEVVALCLS